MNSQSNDEPKGRAKGGFVVASKMSKAQLQERAKKGAATRWGNEPKKALRKGSFKDELGIDAECYVLDDDKKTAVITQVGMGQILGLGTGGSRLPRFVLNKTMESYLGPELRDKIENPLIFQWVGAGQSGSGRAHGYDATILIEICQAILKAKSDGKAINPAVVAQAGIIVGASAKSGIQGLVYAITGFDRTKEEIIQAFKSFVLEEAKKYEKEFPVELYIEWARLYGHRLQRSWKDMHLTIDHVYEPLAKSDGKLLELLRDAKSQSGDRNKKLFQFLNEIGARALRMQLGRVLEMAQSSPDQIAYESKVEERFKSGQKSITFST